MASYFSTALFFILLPASVLLYSIVPRRVRWSILLILSYAFLWVLSGKLIVFVMVSTLSVYVLGLAMGHFCNQRDALLSSATCDKRQVRRHCKNRTRMVLVFGVLLNVGMLAAAKYLGFFASVLSFFGVSFETPLPKIGAPIGISFYTLMAVSYLVDVYRESRQPDKHLGHVALYLVFFPYLMEGPIVRYGQVAPKLWSGDPLKGRNMYAGSLRILWGFAKKLIVADRLNPFVVNVFKDYNKYDGGIIALAAVLYTIQLYCDFSGTMDVALGMSRMFGLSLPENFRQPFFSKTASEFWQRWHITLGAWFKDYVFYPVSLSKPCKSLTKKARRRFGRVVGPLLVSMIALFCVWFGNGLWHGAGSQYIAFGMYYFVMVSLGGFVEPAAQCMAKKWGINRESVPYKAFRITRTLVIVFVGELIFRATGARAALDMLRGIVERISFDSFANGAVFSLGVDRLDFVAVGVCVGVLLVFDVCCEFKASPFDAIARRGACLRAIVWVSLLIAVVVFGAYGLGYAPVDPMYAQF